MKVKSLIILALSLVATNISNAQIADVSWGDPTKLDAKSVNTGIFAEDEDYIFSTRTGPAEYGFSSIYIDLVSKKDLVVESSFEIYNTTMYSSDSKVIRPFQFNEVIKTKDGFIVFFTEPDYVKYTFTSYCQQFNKEGKKVGAVVPLQIFQGHEKTVIGKFIVFRSPLNDGFFLMYSRPFIQYDNEYLIFDFYDYNLEKKWEKKQKFPLNGKEFEPRQYKTNIQDSTLYLVVRVLEETEEERMKKNNKKVNYSFSLLSFKFDPTDTNSTFKSTNIVLPKKYISDISFEVNNHELIFAGFYADKKDMEASGAYTIVLEEYSKLVRSTYTLNFDKKFPEKFYDEETIKLGRGEGIRDFDVKDLQLTNDGSIYLLAENKFAKATAGKVRGFTEIIYAPYYNNVVVVKIANDRKVSWISQIMKRQKEPKFTTNENSGWTLSYTYAIYNDKVVIIYNDFLKNIALQSPLDIQYVSSSKGTVAVMATINSKGEVSEDVLFSGADLKTVLCPKTSIVENKSQIYIYSIIGNTQRWGLFKFY